MMNVVPDGIWPPHEVFYIESMLHSTASALRAADEVREALDAGSRCASSSAEWQKCAVTIVNGVQALVAHAAAISRYVWPARGKEPHLSRAARLRISLGVAESSPLRSRDLRNHIEHFDEKLDQFCGRLTAGVILPTYVGPLGLTRNCRPICSARTTQMSECSRFWESDLKSSQSWTRFARFTTALSTLRNTAVGSHMLIAHSHVHATVPAPTARVSSGQRALNKPSEVNGRLAAPGTLRCMTVS